MSRINPNFGRRKVRPTPPSAPQRTTEPGTGQDAAWRNTRNTAGWILREARNERISNDLRLAVTALLVSLQKLGVTTKLLPPDGHRPRTPLTKRELQVLLGISQGQSNAEIGRALFVSEDTVKTHARRLYRKLRARDRAHAVAVGFQIGLLS